MGGLRRASVDRQVELTNAALHIIATKGIAASSTRSRAARVGLSTGAILRHFASLLDAGAARVHAVLESTYPPRSFVLECLRDGQRTGELRSDLPAEPLVPMVTGPMQVLALSPSKARRRDAEARAVLRSLLALLRSPAVTPTSSRRSSP